MLRDLVRLEREVFDLLIVGGGIHGATIAREAVLRGLTVALVERGDFGHATSANSQKIIHGGFRYLQSMDIKRTRESIEERKILMHLAPHLVHPLPFLIPTYGFGVQNREVMRAGLAVYDLVGWDRNRGVTDPQKRIPRGHIVSRQECLRRAPGIDGRGVTGGAVWYDGQIYNPDRLTLAFIRTAADDGACVANYVKITGLISQGEKVSGLQAVDVLTDRSFNIQGRLVVNTCGPWIDRLLSLTSRPGVMSGVRYAKTINLVTRAMTDDHAVSVVLPKRKAGKDQDPGGRRLYITPWRGRALIGSLHVLSNGNPEGCAVTDEEVERLVQDINLAYPGARLSTDEVTFTHAGLLPITANGNQPNPAHLTGRSKIIDHEAVHGIQRLVSIVGIKYTTARHLAEHVMPLLCSKLDKKSAKVQSAEIPLRGGQIKDFLGMVKALCESRPHGLGKASLTQLAYNHGSDCEEILDLIAGDPSLGETLTVDSPILKAQVVNAVRQEMAQTLADVVLRRTELSTLEHPGFAALQACAEIMGTELGWDSGRKQRELSDVETTLRRSRARPVNANRDLRS